MRHGGVMSESRPGAGSICSRTRICLLCPPGPRARPSTHTAVERQSTEKGRGQPKAQRSKDKLGAGEWGGQGGRRPRCRQVKRGRGGRNHAAALVCA